MSLEIARSALAAMTAAAQQAAPVEACGILLGNASHVASAVQAANVAPDPARHFEIDPAALIAAHKAARAGGLQVLGYFHSHPNGLARPSATDSASAARDGRVWAIVAPENVGASDGTWAITCWHDRPEGFEALSYALVAG
ncbi:Mov34/MPN/PAD-1 family protein [Novosphingobium taihuense]|uniref:Proteasome lid subunit RPN8/RPN11 n=1 Tax=Novosphingobium taihuense TaxID=260085 RepID=A0A7W7A7Z3_9SPHN|nr:M67 family metallopeptidase [Novosphingobium taihuense]MBB4611887.1 proteasome lid subunit RPN8/RPN11 [Novosphingobium taihuense]